MKRGNPNDETRNPNQNRSSNDETTKVYDLEERSALFGERVIRFAKLIPLNAITEPLVKQLIRAATSIGSNYAEADDCDSSKDFKFKIGLCRRESRETKHWLRMLAVAHEPSVSESRVLWKEAKELNLIFGKIRRSVK